MQREHSALRSSLKDIGRCICILFFATLVGHLFAGMGFTEANIITIYILGVLIISLITVHRIYSLISSIISVMIFNFFFTVPQFTFRAYEKGYPVTFLVMFLSAFITGTLAGRLKSHAKQAAQAAYRTKVLLDTNQLLQQASGKNEIAEATAKQIIKLLDRDVVMYLTEEKKLGQLRIFPVDGFEISDRERILEERRIAELVLKNNQHAGATTEVFSDAACLYLAIRVNNKVYGVVGIRIGEAPLDAFENNILLSILGECALALENEKNAREKEEAAVMAKNEQLRANLLRSISHDLRTPLTSISGNASNLLSNGGWFDEETKKQIYTDIYDDAMWLINLVENLLSVTKIEEGRMNLKLSTELIEEIITEALCHVDRKSSEHKIQVKLEEEYMLVRVDARLLIQVIINMVDNAVKYTPKGSEIIISAKTEENMVRVEIADNGPGIPDEMKPRVFDMFYSGANRIADSRRSLGLGLALCKSIVVAHGGSIAVRNVVPHGTVFSFTLPAGEVELHE